jgi:hypothetical protein
MVRRVNVALTRSVNVSLSQYYRYCQWIKPECRAYIVLSNLYFYSYTGLRHDDVCVDVRQRCHVEPPNGDDVCVNATGRSYLSRFTILNVAPLSPRYVPMTSVGQSAEFSEVRGMLLAQGAQIQALTAAVSLLSAQVHRLQASSSGSSSGKKYRCPLECGSPGFAKVHPFKYYMFVILITIFRSHISMIIFSVLAG